MIFTKKNFLTPLRSLEVPLGSLKGHGGDEALSNKKGIFLYSGDGRL